MRKFTREIKADARALRTVYEAACISSCNCVDGGADTRGKHARDCWVTCNKGALDRVAAMLAVMEGR